MATIQHIVLEVDDTAAAESLHAALGVDDRVLARPAQSPATGFRGFTVSLVVDQPAAVRDLVERATAAGASVVKPPAKSLWGYGAVLQDAGGTGWTLASESRKDSGAPSGRLDLVLQLGVADVAASRDFYVGRGVPVTKSYGRRYVELDTGAVTLTLTKLASLAKSSGVPADGSGSHRMAIVADAGDHTDPDGFDWEQA